FGGGRSSQSQRRDRRARRLSAFIERLEDRTLLTAVANLTAYRPVTEFINYAQYPIAEAQETDPALGPGIRFNGDDDNANGLPDISDSAATAAENDLVPVDISASGGDYSLSWAEGLKVWTTSTKSQAVTEAAAYPAGQVSWWVEDVSLAPFTAASLVLTVGEGTDVAQDEVDFHS